MPHPTRALAAAIAALFLFSAVPSAEAAKKRPAALPLRRPARSPSPRPGPPRHRAGAWQLGAPRRAPPGRPARAVPKQVQLERLYDEYWDASMRLNPLQATFQGEPRYNDQLPNILSAAWRQQSHDFTTQWLGKVEKLGSDGLQGQDLLSYEIFVRDARASLAAERYPSWMMPISQYYNIGSIMAILGSGAGAQPFNTVQDYDTWSRRSLGIPELFDQAIDNMRQGMKAGVVQPRDLMVLPQLDAVIKPTAEESIFWSPIRTMPNTIPAEDKARISAEYKRMIELRIMPAYRALRGFIATEYLPATRTSSGLGALPDGQAWYANLIVQTTASDQTAAQLHALGEQRVQELQAQIATVMKDAKLRGSPTAAAQHAQRPPVPVRRRQHADQPLPPGAAAGQRTPAAGAGYLAEGTAGGPCGGAGARAHRRGSGLSAVRSRTTGRVVREHPRPAQPQALERAGAVPA